MAKYVLSATAVLMLLAVNFLAFHDVFEAHTVRDYLTLVASLLVFALVGVDVARGFRRELRR